MSTHVILLMIKQYEQLKLNKTPVIIFETLTAVNIKIMVSLDVTLYRNLQNTRYYKKCVFCLLSFHL